MDSKQAALADYILCLSQSLEHTHHANDRPLYQSYLADISVLMAMLVRGAELSEIQSRIKSHGRLLGWSFIAGPEHDAVAKAWQTFASLYERHDA